MILCGLYGILAPVKYSLLLSPFLISSFPLSSFSSRRQENHNVETIPILYSASQSYLGEKGGHDLTIGKTDVDKNVHTCPTLLPEPLAHVRLNRPINSVDAQLKHTMAFAFPQGYQVTRIANGHCWLLLLWSQHTAFIEINTVTTKAFLIVHESKLIV